MTCPSSLFLLVGSSSSAHHNRPHLHRIVIVGDPGAGKTSLALALRRSALWSCPTAVSVPWQRAAVLAVSTVLEGTGARGTLWLEVVDLNHDLASQGRLAALVMGASCVLVVFDATTGVDVIRECFQRWASLLPRPGSGAEPGTLAVVPVGTHIDQCRRRTQIAIASELKSAPNCLSGSFMIPVYVNCLSASPCSLLSSIVQLVESESRQVRRFTMANVLGLSVCL